MSQIDDRMDFQIAENALRNAYPNYNPKMFALTKSSLIFEQAIIAGQTTYTFPILQVDTSLGIFNTEKRLKYQDSFVATKMAYLICNPGSAVNAAFIPDTYPSPFIYGANAVAMQALYNGTIKYTINNDVIMYNWDLLKHYYSPETQQTAALGAGSPIDQKRLIVDAFDALQPTITLIGTNDNVLQVVLDAAPATFNAFARLRIMLRGVNAQNSTVFVQPQR